MPLWFYQPAVHIACVIIDIVAAQADLGLNREMNNTTIAIAGKRNELPSMEAVRLWGPPVCEPLRVLMHL